MPDYEGMILARAEAYDNGEIGDFCDECKYYDRCENVNFNSTVFECCYELFESEEKKNA